MGFCMFYSFVCFYVCLCDVSKSNRMVPDILCPKVKGLGLYVKCLCRHDWFLECTRHIARV